MDDDKFSSLPEHVKYHILSFIPNIKEVARTSSLSKSWHRTWRSFQITDLDPREIMPEDAFRGPLGEIIYSPMFIRFVYDALMRTRDGMPRFKIRVTSVDMFPHLNRWLGMALDYHVEELSIHIVPDTLPYSIPGRVLSAEFIKSLTLTGGIKIGGASALSLPALRSLHLWNVPVRNQMFQRLVRGCPLLEDLSISYCDNLSVIEVPNLNYLKRVSVFRSGRVPKVISIKASGLESFRFETSLTFEPDFSTVLRISPSVRCLELSSFNQTDEWFCQFLSKLPLLESLTLCRCSLQKKIRISNTLLKKISITCDDLLDIRIDTPKLSSFYYETTKRLPSISTKNPPYDCAVGFKLSCNRQYPCALWFQDFQKFLAKCSTTFRCHESNVTLYESLLAVEDADLSAPGIQHLKLMFGAKFSDYPLVLDGLFAACRPTTFVLTATLPLREFICEALLNREENLGCCSGEAKCWKHKLKNAKIESVKLLKDMQCQEPFYWAPSLSHGKMCLKLQRWD